MPTSERCQELRRNQVRVATLPTNAELARVVAARLAPLPQDEGLGSLDQTLVPVTEVEAHSSSR
jgi:hypothetical protein